MLRDEPVYILTSIEYPAVDLHVGTAAAISALAVEFSDGTPPVCGAFFWIQKVSSAIFRVSWPLTAADDAKIRLVAVG